ncbi:thermonuclease family protein [Pseudomonadota bacterium]
MRIIFFLLLTIHVPYASAATLTGRTVRVTDGDTIVILSEGNVQHKIRLQGIDAPERKQAFGTKSKEHLAESVAGRFVIVEYDKRDRYGRIVGKVLVGGEDACLEQVSAGYAWHYKKYQKEQSETDRILYSEAEKEARDGKRGLWEDPHAIPPWKYRAEKRK